MSGILGIWNRDERPVEPVVFRRMAESLAHRGRDGFHSWRANSAALGCQLLRVTPESATEKQPFVGRSGASVVFDGRLDNRQDVLNHLGPRSVPFDAPDPELVLAVYEQFGERFSEYLNGDFAVAVFDSERGQLLLARDAIGVRPLYYYQTGATLLFASEVKALLAHPERPQQPNEDVLAWYILRRPGVDTRGETFFRGVFSVQPAHIVTITREHIRTRRYWDFDRHKQMRLGSFEEYSEAFRQVFEQAVSRRLRSAYPVAFSVSGGLDSSSIFCTAQGLKAAGSPSQRLLGISFTSPDGALSDEKEFLLEIERKYALCVERVATPLDFLEKVSKPVWHTELPVIGEMTNSMAELFGSVISSGARSMLTGHWGDQVLFDYSYLVTLFRGFRWTEISRHLRTLEAWYPEVKAGIFRRRFGHNVMRSFLPDMLLPVLRKARFRLSHSKKRADFYTVAFREQEGWIRFGQLDRGDFASEHARSLYHTVRLDHCVLCMEMDNKVASRFGVETAYPFLDRDLISFLMSIPGEMQSHEGVPKALLRASMKGVLPEKLESRRGKADGTDILNQAVSSARPKLLELLDPTGMSIRRGYVQPDVAQMVASQKDPRLYDDAQLSFQLADLFGLELWLRLFFAQEEGEDKLPTWA